MCVTAQTASLVPSSPPADTPDVTNGIAATAQAATNREHFLFNIILLPFHGYGINKSYVRLLNPLTLFGNGASALVILLESVDIRLYFIVNQLNQED